MSASWDGTEMGAVLGGPGAATLSPPIPLADGVTRIHLAPAQRWALAEQAGGAGLGLISFIGAVPGAVQLIDGALSTPDRVSFSPNGRAAALFSAGTVQVLRGLDSAPTVAMQTHGPHLDPR